MTWSTKANLISVGSKEELVNRHVLDSLAPATLLRAGAECIDLGSGGGFPGIPLAILRREPIRLIEARRKRATFLRHVVRTLRLQHVTVCEDRADKLADVALTDAVVSRGVERGTVLQFAQQTLRAGGRVVMMEKAGPSPRIEESWEIAGQLSYQLPGGERHRVIALTRRST